jgi:hypothetical protein
MGQRYLQSTREEIINSQEPLPPNPAREKRSQLQTALFLIKNGLDYGFPEMTRKGIVKLLDLVPDEIIDFDRLIARRAVFIQQVQEEKRKHETTTPMPGM